MVAMQEIAGDVEEMSGRAVLFARRVPAAGVTIAQARTFSVCTDPPQQMPER
jgi:hypothetical protein